MPSLSAAALLEWEGHAQSVLRGVAHALNNRAASISALMTLCAEPDHTPNATRELLSVEVDRLGELAGVVRIVGAPTGNVEPFEASDAARSALAVLALHAGLRDRTVTINATVPPLRALRWMFVRALVVLAGRAAANDPRAPIVVELCERDGWVEATVNAASMTRSPYVDEIAVALGGELLAHASGFRVPTLATIRRREGR